MTLSDDLNAIADEIERRGWCQNQAMNSIGQVCIVGGMANAGIGSERHQEARIALCEYLDIEYGSNYDHIPAWNDVKGRTQEEVIQALRDAAIKNQPDSMWG